MCSTKLKYKVPTNLIWELNSNNSCNFSMSEFCQLVRIYSVNVYLWYWTSSYTSLNMELVTVKNNFYSILWWKMPSNWVLKAECNKNHTMQASHLVFFLKTQANLYKTWQFHLNILYFKDNNFHILKNSLWRKFK